MDLHNPEAICRIAISIINYLLWTEGYPGYLHGRCIPVLLIANSHIELFEWSGQKRIIAPIIVSPIVKLARFCAIRIQLVMVRAILFDKIT